MTREKKKKKRLLLTLKQQCLSTIRKELLNFCRNSLEGPGLSCCPAMARAVLPTVVLLAISLPRWMGRAAREPLCRGVVGWGVPGDPHLCWDPELEQDPTLLLGVTGLLLCLGKAGP